MQQKDDVQLFDVDVQGRVPAPRDCHASALLGNKGYISGGMVSWLALALLPCGSSALQLYFMMLLFKLVVSLGKVLSCFSFPFLLRCDNSCVHKLEL